MPSDRKGWVIGLAGIAVAGVAGVGLVDAPLSPSAAPPVAVEQEPAPARYNNLSDAPPYAVLDDGAGSAVPPVDAEARPTVSGEAPHYRYCSEARAAGVAPLYRNDPGYAPHLDRDGDGVACEPYISR